MLLARITASLSTRHPFKTLIIALIPSLTTLIIILSTSSLHIIPPTLSAYFPRETTQTRLYHARLAAKRTYSVPLPETIRPTLHRAKLSPQKSLALLVGPLVITHHTIARVAALERLVAGSGEWPTICRFDALAPECLGDCAKVLSVLNSPHLYGVFNSEGQFCKRRETLPTAGVAPFKQSLARGAFTDSPILVATRGETVLFRSIFQVGVPFEGYNTTDDRAQEQETFYDAWVDRVATQVAASSTSDVPAILFSVQLIHLRVGQQVARDLAFAAPAICLVFAIVWLHTASFFLASVAMLQIFFSFPLAFVIYTYIFRQLYFSALQIFAIFLLLGIGADDVFVFTDAWKQAPEAVKGVGLYERMEWTYRRAVTAMFTTTITTAAAFSITAASPIMPMSTFGIWATVLILVQFLMVITVYPCALVIWQQHLRRKKLCYCVRGPGDGNDAVWTKCLPTAWRQSRGEDGKMRLLERLFHGPWVRVLQLLRIPLVLIGVAVVVVSIYLATRLEPPRGDPQFLPDGHPITVGKEIMENEFRGVNSGRLSVVMTWGILDVDRDGTSRFEPDNIGNVVVDESFDLKQEATQRHIADVCRRLRGNAKLSSDGAPGSDRVSCWIEDFVRWKSLTGQSQFGTYSSDADLMFDVLSFGLYRNTDNKQPFVHYLVEQTIMLSTDQSRVVSCEIAILSPNQTNIPYQEMGEVYKDWQGELARLNELGPPSANKAFVTAGDEWVSQVTQQTLINTMVRNILIMVVVTTFTLSVTTFNVGVSCIATLCLAGIISSLLAAIYVLGWKLGVTESIIITMAMGYSFDGIAHIAMAYTQSARDDRFSRTQDALTTLGISIVFGALSTLCSAAVLLPASVLVFRQLARLVIVTLALTIVWSLVFLPACLLLVGPQGEFLSIKPLLRRLRLPKNWFQEHQEQVALGKNISELSKDSGLKSTPEEGGEETSPRKDEEASAHEDRPS